MNTKSILIVLNGSSSSGKTLTAQALQTRLPGCVITGFDELLERTRPFGKEGKHFMSRLLRNLRIIRFQMTDGRFHLFQQLHHEVVKDVLAGNAVIVETAFLEDRVLRDAAEHFAPLGGYLIGMKPPLVVSEQWEKQRGDRPPGQARRHYDIVHSHQIYDLILDPSHMTPEECAEMILNKLERDTPVAFDQLRSPFPRGRHHGPFTGTNSA